MMRTAFFGTVFSVLAASATVAASTSYNDLRKVARACKADIKALCPAVEPGEGRILACLNQQEDKVSEGCRKAASTYRSDAARLQGATPAASN